MKKIGEILKDARKDKNYSYAKLEEITKIRSSFIEAIEKEKWDTLPPFATVLGFVKSIASALDVDEKMIIAILKRDYIPKKMSINPKPDVNSKPIWGPKLTFIIGIGVVILGILGYLVFQYVRFSSPPRVEILSPTNGQVVVGDSVSVFGTTDSDVKITIDNIPALVDEDGKFSAQISISPTTTKVTIKATARSGKETTIERQINVQSDN